MARKQDDNWFIKSAEAAAEDYVGEERKRKERLSQQSESANDAAQKEFARYTSASASLAADEIPLRKTAPATGNPLPKRLGESDSKRAYEEMSAVISGASPSYAPGPTGTYSPGTYSPGKQAANSKVSAQRGKEAILNEIRNAGSSEDVLKSAGLWLTRITRDISALIKDEGEED
jgi:hypothetical protein